MDVSFLNPFLSSCQDAFSQMFNISPQHKDPYLLNPVGTHPWEISGITTSSVEEKEAMEKDLVTEFTNVITGNAVSAITNKNINVSAPYVITGPNHVIPWPRNTPIIGVPFITRQGTFEVNLCFKGV